MDNNSTQKNDSFVFYRSFIEAIDNLSNESEKIAILKAITSYALDGESVQLEGYLLGYFNLIKPQLDANVKRRANGKKGGRPKLSDNEIKTNGLTKENHGFENSKPNVNVNANNNVNQNVNNNNNVNQNEPLIGSTVYALLKEAKPKCGKPIPIPTTSSMFRITQWDKNKHLLQRFSNDDILQAVKNYIWVLENTLKFEPQEFAALALNIERFIPHNFNTQNYQ